MHRVLAVRREMVKNRELEAKFRRIWKRYDAWRRVETEGDREEEGTGDEGIAGARGEPAPHPSRGSRKEWLEQIQHL